MPKLDYQVLATTLLGSMNESMTGFLKVKPDRDPLIQPKPILVQDNKMIASALTKFADISYISLIYFYKSKRETNPKNAVGALVVYLKQAGVAHVLRALGYNPKEAMNDDALINDLAGELSNNIAGVFKKDLNGLGYSELEISVPYKFRGVVAEGVHFPKKLKEYYELTAYAWKMEPFVVDVILDF